jgi:hypothetical protein
VLLPEFVVCPCRFLLDKMTIIQDNKRASHRKTEWTAPSFFRAEQMIETFFLEMDQTSGARRRLVPAVHQPDDDNVQALTTIFGPAIHATTTVSMVSAPHQACIVQM